MQDETNFRVENGVAMHDETNFRVENSGVVLNRTGFNAANANITGDFCYADTSGLASIRS